MELTLLGCRLDFKRCGRDKSYTLGIVVITKE